MRLELQRKADGTGLMIMVIGRDDTGIAIPLAQDLSNRIDKMLREENIAGSVLISPRKLSA